MRDNWMKYERYIQYRANTFRIPLMDKEDIAQELRIALWVALKDRYDPSRAQEITFAITVLDNKVKDLFRISQRMKRKHDVHSVSLSEITERLVEKTYN